MSEIHVAAFERMARILREKEAVTSAMERLPETGEVMTLRRHGYKNGELSYRMLIKPA